MKSAEWRLSQGLWTKKRTASYYDVSERTIDRWIRSGVIPSEAKVVVGGVVRFRPDVLVVTDELPEAAK